MSSVSKLKNVELADGWSFVTRSKGGRRPARQKSNVKPASQPSDPKVDPHQVLKVREQVDSSLEFFDDNASEVELFSYLQKAIQEARIDTAFCLGLGSLSSGPSLSRKRSMTQLAAFMWLYRSTNPTTDQDPRTLRVIDPGFSATDREVLQHQNMEVHLAYSTQLMSAMEGSLCYAPYLPWPILLLDYLAAGQTRPAILVCQDLKSIKENLDLRIRHVDKNSTINVDGRECTLDDLTNGAKACGHLLKEYQGTNFPTYEPMPYAFQDLMVYMRAG
jgi:hypothetical protein